jgi:predicted naringenin-chalcone synthase
MTVAARVIVAPARAAMLRGSRRCSASLLGLGTALPDRRESQDAIASRLAAHWKLRGAAADRWRRINAGSGIAFRHGVAPVHDVLACSTAERMAMYERSAPPLAANAALAALADARIDPQRITDLIVVSCTGFASPGLDVALVERLGLSANVRRSMIGFMGCFGAITGLRAAVGACAADPHAAALVVCCELCSLHLRDEPSMDNLIASALFADGAAAAVVGGELPRTGGPVAASCPLGRFNLGHSLLLPEGREWMTWRITDAGFAMTLAKEVPVALRDAIGQFVRESTPKTRTYIVHPGGPGILDAVDSGLGLHGDGGLEHARQVLRDCGNMSSGTVLFVLQRAAATPRRSIPLPAMLLAFGPGLTIDSISLYPAGFPNQAK